MFVYGILFTSCRDQVVFLSVCVTLNAGNSIFCGIFIENDFIFNSASFSQNISKKAKKTNVFETYKITRTRIVPNKFLRKKGLNCALPPQKHQTPSLK